MKFISILLALAPLLAVGGDSYFFTYASKPKVVEKRIQGEQLQIIIPIKKIAPPKASSIYASHQGLGRGREYQIQIDLTEAPPEDWLPMLKLGADVIDGGTIWDSSALYLQSDDPEKIRQWCKLLSPLLKVPEDRIEIDLTKGEQAGDGQPATASESKPEGEKKPQPEAQPAPR